ncbi:MAG: pyridoxal-phosphate dependent enzyme, partial [Acidimicrobiia bacterium]|nr:pyridoxal-phosphate dependent enzyme [Acidimicrobiia bacterium]
FSEAVAAGAVPFSVQGSSTPTTIDGGRTIGWELADQIPDDCPVRLFVQIGGGALASAAWAGLSVRSRPVVLHAVQTTACAPLERAWSLLAADLGADVAGPVPDRARQLAGHGSDARRMMEDQPERYMWPWEPVGESAATGILDDVTYDWTTVVGPMIHTGGWPVVVDESQIIEANRLGRAHTGIDVDATGTAGLAGLLDDETRAHVGEDERVVVLFTGVRRS